MSSHTSPLRLACVVIAMLLASSAEAQLAKHSLSGNLRIVLENGLPVPITTNAPPNGRIEAVPGATVMQITGPDPQRMTLHPSQLTAPGNGFLFLPPWPSPAVFEIYTAVAVQFPKDTVTFQASGRTGPPTLTWCPGQPWTPKTYNPSCTNPLASGLPTTGLLRYTRTRNQFGGPAQAALQGTVTIALVVAVRPPCDFETASCLAAFTAAPQLSIGAWGGSFGFYNQTSGPAPNPGIFQVRATTLGAITDMTPTGLAPGLANPRTSFGAPWTTGEVMASARSTFGGGATRFTLTGSDARLSGVGRISLVSAAVSMSQISRGNANGGWLNLTVPEPAALASAASALLLLAVCHALVRRRGR